MIERRRRPSLAELWAQSAGPHRPAEADSADIESNDIESADIEPARLEQAVTRNAPGDHAVDSGSPEDPADDALLVILRGNSGAGKSTLATALRRAEPSMALVEEQSLQRVLLTHADAFSGDDLVDLIDLTVRFFLDRGRSVVLDGLLRTDTFRPTIRSFLLDYRGNVHLYYLDVSFGESMQRHPDRQPRRQSDAELPSQRHVPGDLLAIPEEVVIPEQSTLDATLARITADLSRASSASPRYG